MLSNLSKLKKKNTLLIRYGTDCTYCGKKFKDSHDATLDHVVPKSLGGTNLMNNLVLCCNRCNSRKGNLLLTDYIKKYKIKLTERIVRLL